MGRQGGRQDRVQDPQQHRRAGGPKEIKVLNDLGRMDTDGDEFVTLSEMLAFFGACSEVMSDEEFATIMGDMSDVAATTTGVAKMIAMTNDAAATAGVVGEGEEIEPPPEMSPEREPSSSLSSRRFQRASTRPSRSSRWSWIRNRRWAPPRRASSPISLRWTPTATACSSTAR